MKWTQYVKLEDGSITGFKAEMTTREEWIWNTGFKLCVMIAHYLEYALANDPLTDGFAGDQKYWQPVMQWEPEAIDLDALLEQVTDLDALEDFVRMTLAMEKDVPELIDADTGQTVNPEEW